MADRLEEVLFVSHSFSPQIRGSYNQYKVHGTK